MIQESQTSSQGSNEQLQAGKWREVEIAAVARHRRFSVAYKRQIVAKSRRARWSLSATKNTMGLLYFVLKIALAATVGFAVPVAADSAEKVGYNGFGDIRVGMSLWKLLQVLGQHATIESIESGCTNVYRAASDDIIYMVVDDALTRVEIRTPILPTISGIKVGATEQDILAAYRDRVEISDHEYQEGHYLTVYSSNRKSAVVFDTDGTQVRSFRIGRLPEALYIEGCS